MCDGHVLNGRSNHNLKQRLRLPDNTFCVCTTSCDYLMAKTNKRRGTRQLLKSYQFQTVHITFSKKKCTKQNEPLPMR